LLTFSGKRQTLKSRLPSNPDADDIDIFRDLALGPFVGSKTSVTKQFRTNTAAP
jgi:hypothetical protein